MAAFLCAGRFDGYFGTELLKKLLEKLVMMLYSRFQVQMA